MSTPVIESVAAPERLMQLASGYMVSAALNAVARLKIADHLANGPLSAADLAAQSETNTDALERVMRLLASVGIFDEPQPQTFGINKISSLMRSDAPNSMLDTVTFLCDSTHFQIYADLVPTIKDGRTASEHIYGKGIFEVFASDSAAQSRFDNAMTNMTQQGCSAVLEAYDFSGIGTLVDVAGGHGFLLSSILQKYPAMSGVLFDLAHVVEGAQKRIAAMGIAERCQTVAGDFFEAVPSGDAIVMKHIIHDWEEAKAIKILQNCHKALSERKGRLLLIEMLLSPEPGPHVSKVLDVEMLVLPGGRERTKEQFASLLEKSGFKLEKVVKTQSHHVVLEASCM